MRRFVAPSLIDRGPQTDSAGVTAQALGHDTSDRPLPSSPDASSGVGKSGLATFSQNSHELRVAEKQFGGLFRLGYQSFHQQRYARALGQFQQAVNAAPHLAEGHYYLGLAYAKLMMHDKAEQEYRSALDRMSDFRPAEEKLCMLLHERGDYREAMSRLQRMLQDNDRDAFALGELAINQLAMDDWQAATTLLEKYNDIRGRQAWGTAHLGRAFDLQGETSVAEQYYREALEIDPNFAIAHYWLGLLLGREGKQEAAQESFAQYDRLRSLLNTEHSLNMALLRNDHDVDALIRLAKVRYDVGRREEAVSTLKRAHRLAPSHPEIAALRRRWSASLP